MKTYKHYSKAAENSNGLPIIRIASGGEQLYIVLSGDTVNAELSQIELIANGGGIAGQVGLRNLNRLGNANYAEPNPKCIMHYNAFPDEDRK